MPSPLTNITAILDYLRLFILDEPDQNAITDANLRTFLAHGESDLRARVALRRPDWLATQVEITVNNAFSYDLAGGTVQILGDTATLTGQRLLSLIDVARLTAPAGTVTRLLKSVNSLEDLAAHPTRDFYYLQNTTLIFGAQHSNTYRLIYVPESQTNWSTGADLPANHRLTEFNDLIALYAFQHWAMFDLGSYPNTEKRLAAREAALDLHLSRADPGVGSRVTRRPFRVFSRRL